MSSTKEKFETKKLPMMPIRDVVIFPFMMTPFVVGRESSVRALEEALAHDKRIFLATQHDASVDEPKPNEIYQVGTVVNIVQSLKLPDGNIKVLVEGLERGKTLQVTEVEGYLEASVRTVKSTPEVTPQIEAAMQRVISQFEQYVKLCQSLNYETMAATVRPDDIAKLTDTIAANLQLTIEEKQELLEIFDPADRLNRVLDVLDIEIEKLNMDRTIQSRVKRQMERAQKEYYLNEKIKAIQKELGRGEKSEFDELKKKIDSSGMSKEVHEKAIQELKKLEAMPPMSAESTVSRNYLDWLLAVPWKKKSKEVRDIEFAEKILNEDHYGLEKIKDRILEFLAVRQLVKNPKGSILCFVGPPGVGKTSLGMSIAKATGRKFVRMSLGGVRDEAEIRGHRRTYIGALPGQIIQMMKKAGTKNPVFMLDEVDKMSADFRGDPSSALLEVLDPEQNFMFIDHYLDVEYDLSQVFFIATANVLHTIPAALQDRMEVLRLHGYTEPEKLEIAKHYLVKKQREQAGLKTGEHQLHRRCDHRHHPLLHARGRGPQPGAGNRQRLPQGGAPGGEGRSGLLDRGHGRKHQRLPWRDALPRHGGQREERNWPGYGIGVDRSRRHDPVDGSNGGGRQRRQADADRQVGRRHAGIGAGGHHLYSLALAATQLAPRLLPQHRHSYPCAGGRDPQGRSFGGHHHGDRDCQRSQPDPRAARRRHDRRDHASRQSAADRRAQGKAAGGQSRRHYGSDSAAGK